MNLPPPARLTEFWEGAEDSRLRDAAAQNEDFAGGTNRGLTRKKLAFFLAENDSNFRALHASTLNNSIFGVFTVVVSDNPWSTGCEYARKYQIPVLNYPGPENRDSEGSTADMVEALIKYEVDYVLLAGPANLIPEALVKAFPRSILNIHPSLLPAFGRAGYYGMEVHEDVRRSGARFTGTTVYFVDENYHAGPILAQRVVPILPSYSAIIIAAKVWTLERVLYSEVVAALCKNHVSWQEDGVPMIRRTWNVVTEYPCSTWQ